MNGEFEYFGSGSNISPFNDNFSISDLNDSNWLDNSLFGKSLFSSVDKNDNCFSKDKISDKNSFIGKKRKKSKASNYGEELIPFKTTKRKTPKALSNKEESLSIRLINDNVNNSNDFNFLSNNDTKNNKKTEKKIFKIIKDLPLEKILKKKGVPNNHIMDYYFQHFKTEFVHFYTEFLNKIIEKCKFKKKIGKFSVPNSESFQKHSDYSDNKKYLNYKMEDIYTTIEYAKKYKGRNQKKNHGIKYKIKSIECSNKNEYDILIYLLTINLKEAYKIFYDNKMAFFLFEKNEDTRYYEYYFKKIYGYSLLENYGIINFINNNK